MGYLHHDDARAKIGRVEMGEQEISPDLDTFNALTLRQLQWLAKSHPPTDDPRSPCSALICMAGLVISGCCWKSFGVKRDGLAHSSWCARSFFST